MLLSATLLLATTSSLVRGHHSSRPEEAVGASAGMAANAPWRIVEVDTARDFGQHASVAIDPLSGRPCVSYYDATNHDLRMAHYVGFGGNCGARNDWHCQTVDSGVDVGKYSSIAIYPGYPFGFGPWGIGIAYHDATNGSLKYATTQDPQGGPWAVHTIERGISSVSTTGLYPSLKFSDSGNPVIAHYFDNPTNVDALKLAYYSVASGNCESGDLPDSWRCETIITGEGVGQYPSLADIDEFEFHVAYYDGGRGDLWYATSVGEGNCGPYGTDWSCYPISSATNVGQYASLYLDGEDHFHIAYYDATSHMLKYAVQVDSGGNCGVLGSAQCHEIDAMMQGYNPLGVSVAEDVAGYPVIAYQSQYGALNVARPLAALGLPPGSGNCGPEIPLATWHCETIDPAGTWKHYRNGDFVSIAVDSAGLATIAYYGFITPEGGNLVVAYQRFQVYLPVVVKS